MASKGLLRSSAAAARAFMATLAGPFFPFFFPLLFFFSPAAADAMGFVFAMAAGTGRRDDDQGRRPLGFKGFSVRTGSYSWARMHQGPKAQFKILNLKRN
jgi:hypothetical protein